MKDVKHSIVITVSSPKVIPLATEPKYKKIIILKNDNGETVELKSHQITRTFRKFLEGSGLSIEDGEAPSGCKGKTEIAGVDVKVSAIAHTNYDSGAIIKVPEEDELSLKNTLKVLKYLKKGGVDIDKHCQTNEKGTSCLAKLREELK